MRRSRLSLAGLSILFALGLALWEVYFFWFAGSLGLEAPLGVFTPDRLGFNMAWLAAIYLTFQLTSIPFALPSATGRFIGVVDGMASLVPLAVAPAILPQTPGAVYFRLDKSVEAFEAIFRSGHLGIDVTMPNVKVTLYAVDPRRL